MIFNPLDFLQNGQKIPSVADWQKCLLKDADGVLSVCRQIGEVLSKLDSLRVLFERERSAAKEEMGRLLNALQFFSLQLPRPQGFFSGAEDRKSACRVSCCFLEGLERGVAEISQHDAAFLCLFSSLREQEAHFLQAEALLEDIQKAAKRQGVDVVFMECQECLERIGTQRKEKALFRGELKRVKEELQVFCQRTVPDFCRRVAASADLEHEGAQGSPQGILRLFGELRHEVERIFSML